MPDKTQHTFQKIIDSPGMAFQSQMKKYSFSYNIFSGNKLELEKGIQLIETPDIGLKLMSEANKEAGDQAHKEINRLFHNFLASAKTLIEHTRIFVNKHYDDTPIQQAYSEKIKHEFAQDELCKFIQDLRNYMLHQGLPHNQMSLSFDSNNPDFESTISLETKKLLAWQKWSASSKVFLQAQEENIKFSSIVSPYGNKIISLHEWLHKKLYKHHSNDLKQLKELQNEFQRAQQKT